MEFDEVFWLKDNDQFVLYPAPDSDNDHPCLDHAYVVNNLWIFAGGKELCIQTSNPLTSKVEVMTDQEVYEFFELLLKLFRTEPYKDLPRLVSVETTKWTQDPYPVYCTYSAVKVNDDPYLFMDFLDKNHKSRVQFAGEHCTIVANGCVHGAFATGYITAKNVLNNMDIAYELNDTPVTSPDI
jgi:polyamine oxidase